MIALLIPDRGPSGAKTTRSPSPRRALASAWMPFARKPSSFVIKIKGLSFVMRSIFYIFKMREDTE